MWSSPVRWSKTPILADPSGIRRSGVREYAGPIMNQQPTAADHDRASALTTTHQWTQAWLPEDEATRSARSRCADLATEPISPSVGALLATLAATVDARSVVEIGTGTGVSALWLLKGMRSDGVLTSIDMEAEHQRIAKECFASAQVPAGRTRLITGRALDVLPRLADRAYDLVFIDADEREYDAYVEHAVRLLRPGGLLVIDDALRGDRVADPARRDAATIAVRALVTRLRDDDRLVPVLLPVGEGILIATVRPSAAMATETLLGP
jgi:predicted O-methyltransferase YrrM